MPLAGVCVAFALIGTLSGYTIVIIAHGRSFYPDRLMGRGVVHPVDQMGDRPWSEDLLDYLGTYLSDHGYDLKTLMEHIAISTSEQSTGIQQITRGIHELHKITQDNTEGSHNLATTSTTTTDQVANLSQLIAGFRV